MTATARKSVLAYLEDPGAVSFFLPLYQDLAAEFDFELFASGFAAQKFSELGIDFLRPGHNLDQQLAAFPRPCALLVGTAEALDTPGFAFIEWARKNKVPSVGLVDARMNAERRFSGNTRNPLHFRPDYIVVPDSWTRKQFASLGIEEEKLVVCESPNLTKLRTGAKPLTREERYTLRRNLFPSLSPEKKWFVFLTEISTGLDPELSNVETFTLRGSRAHSDRTKIALEEFARLVSKMSPGTEIILRLHPKDAANHYTDLSGLFQQIHRQGGAKELLQCADLVAGLTTTMLAEAFAMGVQTLSIVTRPEEKLWLRETADGIIPCACTREELSVIMEKICSGESRMAPTPAAAAPKASPIKDLLESLCSPTSRA